MSLKEQNAFQICDGVSVSAPGATNDGVLIWFEKIEELLNALIDADSGERVMATKLTAEISVTTVCNHGNPFSVYPVLIITDESFVRGGSNNLASGTVYGQITVPNCLRQGIANVLTEHFAYEPLGPKNGFQTEIVQYTADPDDLFLHKLKARVQFTVPKNIRELGELFWSDEHLAEPEAQTYFAILIMGDRSTSTNIYTGYSLTVKTETIEESLLGLN